MAELPIDDVLSVAGMAGLTVMAWGAVWALLAGRDGELPDMHVGYEVVMAGAFVFSVAVAVSALRRGNDGAALIWGFVAAIAAFGWWKLRRKRRKGKRKAVAWLGYKARAAKAKLMKRLRSLRPTPRRWLRPAPSPI